MANPRLFPSLTAALLTRVVFVFTRSEGVYKLRCYTLRFVGGGRPHMRDIVFKIDFQKNGLYQS